jgi:hypothetical protein
MDFALSFLNCFLLILIHPDISVIGVFPDRKENKFQWQLISTMASKILPSEFNKISIDGSLHFRIRVVSTWAASSFGKLGPIYVSLQFAICTHI